MGFVEREPGRLSMEDSRMFAEGLARYVREQFDHLRLPEVGSRYLTAKPFSKIASRLLQRGHNRLERSFLSDCEAVFKIVRYVPVNL